MAVSQAAAKAAHAAKVSNILKGSSSAATSLLGGIGSLIGGGSHAQQAYSDYSHEIQGLSDTYQPFVDQGKQALREYYDASNANVQHPTDLINQIASTYQDSPYMTQSLNQSLSQTQDMMNRNAATTGMLGSTSANKALQSSLMGQAAGYRQQSMQDYINQVLGTYRGGMGGLSEVGRTGLSALSGQAGLQEQAMAAEAKAQNTPSSSDSMWGDALGALGGILGGVASIFF